MTSVTSLLIAIVALLHIGFLTLEMFFWTNPIGLKIFGYSLEDAQASALLAANQGLYNGFLAAGLIWGLRSTDAVQSRQIKIFFLSCIVVAAIYGSISANPKIILVQGLPAVVALCLLLYRQSKSRAFRVDVSC